jgi:DNA polymerase III delta subunit
MSEVEKLRYRKSRNPSLDISLATVEDVTFGMTETNSFKFFDHLLTDPPASCKILDDIQHDGTDRNQTAGMLYRGLRNNLIILDFLRQGIDDSKTIASEAKMNPRQVSTLLKQQSTLLAKEHFIKNLFKKLIELECDIKTGKVPAEYFRLGVKELLLKNP